VGGYDDLPDIAGLTNTIEITPNAGEKVEIVRSSEIEVGDGMLVLQILNEEFIRGGTGTVRFTLENTGVEEIEITTARNSGSSASNEVIYYLMDGRKWGRKWGRPLKGKSREKTPLHTKKHLVFFAWLQCFAPVQLRFRLLFRTRYFYLFGSQQHTYADSYQSPIGIKARCALGRMLKARPQVR